MTAVEIIFVAILGAFVGYCFAVGEDECPMLIQGYKCKQDFCNHSKYEVRKAKEIMRGPRPPFNQFRP